MQFLSCSRHNFTHFLLRTGISRMCPHSRRFTLSVVKGSKPKHIPPLITNWWLINEVSRQDRNFILIDWVIILSFFPNTFSIIWRLHFIKCDQKPNDQVTRTGFYWMFCFFIWRGHAVSNLVFGHPFIKWNEAGNYGFYFLLLGS